GPAPAPRARRRGPVVVPRPRPRRLKPCPGPAARPPIAPGLPGGRAGRRRPRPRGVRERRAGPPRPAAAVPAAPRSPDALVPGGLLRRGDGPDLGRPGGDRQVPTAPRQESAACRPGEGGLSRATRTETARSAV